MGESDEISPKLYGHVGGGGKEPSVGLSLGDSRAGAETKKELQ